VAQEPREILPGLWHWRDRHPVIDAQVDSFWLPGEGIVFDPLLPPGEGLARFESAGERAPHTIVCSNRHHARHTAEYVEAFGCRVLVPAAGRHEFEGRSYPIEPYEPGDELEGVARVVAIAALCPDDMALVLPGFDAVLFADAVVRGAGEKIGFVPDSLMEDPERDREKMLGELRRLLEEISFSNLLMAHGGPVLRDGRERLEQMVQAGGPAAFEF
jgi:hypothetical protein